MKTLEQIKDEVAKYFGYESFEKFDDNSTFSYDHKTPKIIDEIAKRYAREVAQASLDKAAENANMKVVTLGIEDCSQMTKSFYHKPSATEISLNKSSITNESNIVML